MYCDYNHTFQPRFFKLLSKNRVLKFGKYVFLAISLSKLSVKWVIMGKKTMYIGIYFAHKLTDLREKFFKK